MLLIKLTNVEFNRLVAVVFVIEFILLLVFDIDVVLAVVVVVVVVVIFPDEDMTVVLLLFGGCALMFERVIKMNIIKSRFSSQFKMPDFILIADINTRLYAKRLFFAVYD